MSLIVFYSLLIVALIATVLYLVKRWHAVPDEQRAAFTKKAVLYLSAAIIFGLVLAGRAPWLMGVLAALLALLGRVAQFAQYVPLFKKVMGDEQRHEESQQASAQVSMDKQQAADILGISPNASAEQIKQAHKKLMQKVHPDRGGSDALASQINAAKDILLNS